MKRFFVLMGNYGSGKTELSINMALDLAGKGQVALADMDVVNPYFRSSEHIEMLAQKGVRVIAPPFANTTVDVPSLSAEVYAAFESEYAVFDAGGDPVGATPLAAYRQYFSKVAQEREVYYVVNARRPFQRNINDAYDMLLQVQAVARLKIDALINNTNTASETSVGDLLDGYNLCAALSEKLDIPIAFSSGTPDIVAAYLEKGGKGPVRPIEIYTRLTWMD